MNEDDVVDGERRQFAYLNPTLLFLKVKIELFLMVVDSCIFY
jgi:hypothetical protein